MAVLVAQSTPKIGVRTENSVVDSDTNTSKPEN
jgi:hypothetical protein